MQNPGCAHWLLWAFKNQTVLLILVLLHLLPQLQLFNANTADEKFLVYIVFDQPLITSIIQVEPRSCRNKCQLKLEILGCFGKLSLCKGNTLEFRLDGTKINGENDASC